MLEKLTALPQISAGFDGPLGGGGKRWEREGAKGRGKGRNRTKVTGDTPGPPLSPK